MRGRPALIAALAGTLLIATPARAATVTFTPAGAAGMLKVTESAGTGVTISQHVQDATSYVAVKSPGGITTKDGCTDLTNTQNGTVTAVKCVRPAQSLTLELTLSGGGKEVHIDPGIPVTATVTAGPGNDKVVRSAAGQEVRAVAADRALDVQADGVAFAGLAVDGAVVEQRHPHAAGAALVADRVAHAVAALEHVRAGAAVEPVEVPGPAVERVVAGGADQRIGARAAVKDIIPRVALRGVVARAEVRLARYGDRR